MRVLVATRAPSSDVDGFTFTREGELVRVKPLGECGNAMGCGCGRSFTGLDTHRATTVAKVVELELTREVLLEKFVTSTLAAGFRRAEDQEVRENEAIDAMLALAAEHPLGGVVAHPDTASSDEP